MLTSLLHKGYWVGTLTYLAKQCDWCIIFNHGNLSMHACRVALKNYPSSLLRKYDQAPPSPKKNYQSQEQLTLQVISKIIVYHVGSLVKREKLTGI